MNFKLNLTRPIAFFDLETTGVNVGSDRIIDISILKLDIDNNKITKNWRVNPGVPIPEESTKIHKITNEDVVSAPLFKTVAGEIAAFLDNCDLAGYNSNRFDVPMLVEELMRAEIDFDLENRKLIDVQNVFHFMEQRTLSAAHKFYCNKEMVNAHNAQADTEATYNIFCAQLKMYEKVEREDENGNKYFPVQNDMNLISDLTTRSKNVDLVGRIVYNENNTEVFAFGKYKDKPVKEVFKTDIGYYGWMMKGDFPEYTKKVISRLRQEMLAADKK